jgi:hypothetical protein
MMAVALRSPPRSGGATMLDRLRDYLWGVFARAERSDSAWSIYPYILSGLLLVALDRGRTE